MTVLYRNGKVEGAKDKMKVIKRLWFQASGKNWHPFRRYTIFTKYIPIKFYVFCL